MAVTLCVLLWPREGHEAEPTSPFSTLRAETSRLEQKGLAHAQRSFTGRRRRTVYAISDAGRRVVDEWLATPPRPTSLEAEPVLRVVLSDLGTRDQLFAALEQIRRDAEAILDVGRVVAPEYLKGTAPFQDQVHVRAFLFDFLSHFAFTLSDWANRTEAQVKRWEALDDAERSSEAVALIARVMQEYPADRGAS